jgi:hypothetical protein
VHGQPDGEGWTPPYYLEASSYQPAIELNGDVLADSLHDTCHEVVGPYLDALDPIAGTDWRGTEFGVPFGAYPTIIYLPRQGDTARVPRYSEKAWNRYLGRVRRGDWREIGLQIQFFRSDGRADTFIRVELEAHSVEFPSWPDTFSMTTSSEVVGGRLERPVQDLWVAQMKRWALRLGAVTGYFTKDHAAARESPLEQAIRHPNDYATRFGELCRGYYWGNLLSSRHIERLGGLDRIKAQAPCSVVEAVDRQSDLVYLQLSAGVDDFTDEQLARLKAFLAPVLPDDPPMDPYLGPRLRLV